MRTGKFLEQVMREIRTTLKVNAKIISLKNRNYHKLRISDKELFITISELIRKRLKSPTKAFIQGIIDAEGMVIPKEAWNAPYSNNPSGEGK